MIAANTPQTGNGENAVNRENVIRGLGVCSPIGCAKEKCPYYEGPESEFWGNPDGYECEFNLRQDAIKLLKTQEPKPPIIKENSYGWKFYYCASCGKEFYQNNKFSFCEKCGQAVKWE